ncbi:MAG: TetR/AcrR family transcriptional regulator [Pseudomonadota bacterium]
MNKHVTSAGEDLFTERQRQVLDCALAVLVAGGEKAITTAKIAKSANCSKESLYKWFGDRDGILSAMITHQASKVKVPAESAAIMRSLDEYRRDLNSFGIGLLTVLSGSTSLALNRLAIGQSNSTASPLGDLLVARGRRMVRDRGKSLIERAKMAGHIRYDNADLANDTFYGLLVADGHVRMLLGERVSYMVEALDRERHVERAVEQFLKLVGTQETIDQIN